MTPDLTLRAPVSVPSPTPTNGQSRSGAAAQAGPRGASVSPAATSAADPAARYRAVRGASEALAAPLATEDYVIQSMPDVSPTKWHLAHTSWFFETFVLAAGVTDYRPFHPRYSYLFNSYYNAVGERHCRPNRGLLSRPTVEEVYAYRAYVDAWMLGFLERGDPARRAVLGPVIELGLHHEQQHQELLLTDIKHVFASNPLRPIYRERAPGDPADAPPPRWLAQPGGLAWIGYAGGGFAFDNELPRHQVFTRSFELGSRLVTNGEYRAFIADGGYQRPELWLSDGWNAVRAGGWDAPLYWDPAPGGEGWWHMTLSGYRPVDDAEPVCHISFYEADAYARWAGARLPTEAEWELTAAGLSIHGNFVEAARFHPAPAERGASHGASHGANGHGSAIPSDNGGGIAGDALVQNTPSVLHGGTAAEQPLQMFGDVWEWTASPYLAYPGYAPAAGALGEYNGKFMCNQMVLRGGSCATPASHIRPSYRNFFPPDARWQFSGLRLARDLAPC